MLAGSKGPAQNKESMPWNTLYHFRVVQEDMWTITSMEMDRVLSSEWRREERKLANIQSRKQGMKEMTNKGTNEANRKWEE